MFKDRKKLYYFIMQIKFNLVNLNFRLHMYIDRSLNSGERNYNTIC